CFPIMRQMPVMISMGGRLTASQGRYSGGAMWRLLRSWSQRAMSVPFMAPAKMRMPPASTSARRVTTQPARNFGLWNLVSSDDIFIVKYADVMESEAFEEAGDLGGGGVAG